MKFRFLIPALLMAASAQAQSTMNLQNFVSGNAAGDQGQKLQQALATGVLLGCVKKQAGTERTQAFYAEIQDTGKQVKTLCKTGQADAARQVVLAKLDAKKTDPMLPIIHTCYQQQASNVAALSSPQIAADIAKYDNWAMHPDQAHAQMTDQDVCKPKAAHP